MEVKHKVKVSSGRGGGETQRGTDRANAGVKRGKAPASPHLCVDGDGWRRRTGGRVVLVVSGGPR